MIRCRKFWSLTAVPSGLGLLVITLFAPVRAVAQFDVEVNFREYEYPVIPKRLLTHFAIRGITETGVKDENKLTHIGKVTLDVAPAHLKELRWSTTLNKGYVLWPHSDKGPFDSPHRRFKVRTLGDVLVQSKNSIKLDITAGEYERANEAYLSIRSLFEGLPPPEAPAEDERGNYHHSLLREMCEKAATFRNTWRYRRLAAAKQQAFVEREAEWRMYLLDESTQSAADSRMRRVSESLSLWNTFAHEVYTKSRPNWANAKVGSPDAFRSPDAQGAFKQQFEAVVATLAHPSISVELGDKIEKNLAASVPSQIKVNLECLRDKVLLTTPEDILLSDIESGIGAFLWLYAGR